MLKKLCDLFAVDRAKINDKDGLIEVLLDFLGEPSEDKLKGKGKKEKEGAASSKKESSKKIEKEDSDEEIEEGKMPTEKQLRQWVRAYVQCFNTSKATLKHAMGIAEEKFGVSLAEKKEQIKEILAEEM